MMLFLVLLPPQERRFNLQRHLHDVELDDEVCPMPILLFSRAPNAVVPAGNGAGLGHDPKEAVFVELPDQPAPLIKRRGQQYATHNEFSLARCRSTPAYKLRPISAMARTR